MTPEAPVRDRTVSMLRVRNEARWIRRCVDSLWPVARTVVIFDDGSTDETLEECIRATGPGGGLQHTPWGEHAWGGGEEQDANQLHIIHSPYTGAIRPMERCNEIRDKNHLWFFLKCCIPFDHVVCLDGDEQLSRRAQRVIPEMCAAMDAADGPDMVQLPFVYLWDGEAQQRCDGIYGAAGWNEYAWDAPEHANPCTKHLRFPRLFTIRHLSPEQLFDMHFRWLGGRGGFHCGSVPQEAFKPRGVAPKVAFAPAPVLHYGYIDVDLRQRKFQFYNTIDPGNDFEGGYKHIIGEPDYLAPGPVRLAPYVDTP